MIIPSSKDKARLLRNAKSDLCLTEFFQQMIDPLNSFFFAWLISLIHFPLFHWSPWLCLICFPCLIDYKRFCRIDIAWLLQIRFSWLVFLSCIVLDWLLPIIVLLISPTRFFLIDYSKMYLSQIVSFFMFSYNLSLIKIY